MYILWLLLLLYYTGISTRTSVPPLTINRVGEVFVSDRLRSHKTRYYNSGVVKRGEHDFFSSLIRLRSTSPWSLVWAGGGRGVYADNIIVYDRSRSLITYNNRNKWHAWLLRHIIIYILCRWIAADMIMGNNNNIIYKSYIWALK